MIIPLDQCCSRELLFNHGWSIIFIRVGLEADSCTRGKIQLPLAVRVPSAGIHSHIFGPTITQLSASPR